MNNIFFIAMRELKCNKKMTLIMILSVLIVTILINSISTLTLSYQQYIIDLSRNKENWEIAIDNIEYDNIKYIENDKNVKQVSIVQDVGTSDNSYSEGFTELIHIKAYDNNALENLKINLKKGRFPKTTSEIIINEDMNFEIGENITAVINGIEHLYTIVGELENTDFDEFNYKELKKVNGAITLCNKTNIKDTDYINISLVSYNISDIYNTANRIKEELNTKNQSPNIRYNEELLSYACVAEQGSEFQTSITIVVRFANRNNSNIVYCFNIYHI